MSRIEPGAIIRDAWGIYTEQAAVLLPVAFALYGISAMIAYGGAGVLGSLLTLIIQIFYQGMVVQLVRDVQDGRRDSSSIELLQSVMPVAGPLLAVAVLSGIAIGIGFVLLIAPGLFLLTIWAVVAPVVVVERPGVFAAFGRSHALVRGNGWPVCTTILIIFLISFVLSAIVLVAASGLGPAGVYGLSWIVESLTAPLAALISSVLYFALVGRNTVRSSDPFGAPEPPLVAPEAPEGTAGSRSVPPPGY